MSFIEIQNEFMSHIRDPNKHNKPDDIEERRIAIYRDLFFNNIEGFISSGFPVLKTLYTDDKWQTLIRRFFSEYDCHSPYFLDIAAQFVNYLTSDYKMTEHDPAFMIELAHYEWVELDISIANEDEKEQKLQHDELTSGDLYLSRVSRNLSYQYPVQNVSANYKPIDPSPTPHYFVVYRDEDHNVQFLTVNAMTALLLSILDTFNGIKFKEVCHQVLNKAPQFSLEQITQGALTTLVAMAQRGIVVTKNQD